MRTVISKSAQKKHKRQLLEKLIRQKLRQLAIDILIKEGKINNEGNIKET